jgi:hypothetical protein
LNPRLKTAQEEQTKKPRKVAKIIALVLGAIVLCWIAFVIATRWVVANDASDIQGTWNIAGTDKEVPITSSEMTLTDDLTYSYTLDEFSKTIEVKLGSKSGKSHYVFSLNRQQIVIIDGEYDFFSSLAMDLSDFFSSIVSGTVSAQSAGYKSDESGRTIIRLNKVS